MIEIVFSGVRILVRPRQICGSQLLEAHMSLCSGPEGSDGVARRHAVKSGFLPLFEPTLRDGGEDLTKRVFAFTVVHISLAIADHVESVFGFPLHIIPMCLCDSFESYKMER
jgi:hypothetical protein